MPSEDEEGEISQSTPSIRDKDNLGYSPSDEYLPSSKQAKPTPKKGDADKELDAIPPNAQELNSARLSRYEIVDIMFKDGWEEVAIGKLLLSKRGSWRFGTDSLGAYVRLMAQEPDAQGRPKYRVHKIEGKVIAIYTKKSSDTRANVIRGDRGKIWKIFYRTSGETVIK